jgi:hypothetical protein
MRRCSGSEDPQVPLSPWIEKIRGYHQFGIGAVHYLGIPQGREQVCSRNSRDKHLASRFCAHLRSEAIQLTSLPRT